jgi:hypothetical protein
MVDFKKLTLNRTLAFGLIIFALVLGGGEYLARQPEVQAHLPYPEVGGGYDVFDTQFYLLESHIREHGKPECIFVGSSVVRAGVSTSAFEAGYMEQTGQPINCFNFGVAALNVTIAPPVVEMLINRYEPPLIIYGVAMFEYNTYFYTAAPGQEPLPLNLNPQTILNSSWLRYQNGNLNLSGWAADRSLLYRYSLVIPEALAGHAGETPADRPAHPLIEGGIQTNPSLTLSSPLHLLTHNPRNRLDVDLFSEFELHEPSLANLRTIVGLSRPESRIVAVEFPTYDLPSIPAVRSPVLETVREMGVPFWQTDHLEISRTAQDFIDPVHLHFFAATDLSYWLGQQVGAATQQGLFDNPINEELIDGPPLADLDRRSYDVDIAHYLEGWFDAYGGELPTPMTADSRLFNPANVPYDRAFITDTLGLYVELIAEDEEKATLAELGVILDHMHFEHEADLSQDEQANLEQWRQSFRPQALRNAGIDFLIYSNVWFSFTSEEAAARLNNPEYYKPLGEWWHPPLQMNFFLFEVVDTP